MVVLLNTPDPLFWVGGNWHRRVLSFLTLPRACLLSTPQIYQYSALLPLFSFPFSPIPFPPRCLLLSPFTSARPPPSIHPPPMPHANKAKDLLLTLPPWSSTHPFYAHTLFVTAPPPLARKRLAARHLAAGLAATFAAADQRAVENDLPNGEHILRFLDREGVDDFVESLEDGGWSQ